MKKRIHILTAEEHRKLMVDPDKDWIKECSDPKYRGKYFVLSPTGANKDEVAPDGSHYKWPVMDTAGMRMYGKPFAYFISLHWALSWSDRQNVLCPPPPKPPMPVAPYPVGTYYAVETDDHRYEVRRVSNPMKRTKDDKAGQHHFSWAEKIISLHDTKEEAKLELIRLITRK